MTMITGVTLQGFRVFEGRTVIPFERLTLLFGPNSAGKSSVQAALELHASMQAIDWFKHHLDSRLEFANHNAARGKRKSKTTQDTFRSFISESDGLSEFGRNLSRSWRRSDGIGKHSEVMRIGVSHKVDQQVGLQKLMSTDDPYLVREGTDQQFNQTPGERLCPSRDFHSEFSFTQKDQTEIDLSRVDIGYQLINGNQLLICDDLSGFSVNLDHPLLRPQIGRIDYAALGDKFPKEVTFCDGYVTFKRRVVGFRANGSNFMKSRENWLSFSGTKSEDVESKSFEPELRACLAQVSILVGSFLVKLHDILGHRAQVVEASRTVPDIAETNDSLGMWEDGERYDFGWEYDFSTTRKYGTLVDSLSSELLANTYLNNTEADEIRDYSKIASRTLTQMFPMEGYKFNLIYRGLNFFGTDHKLANKLNKKFSNRSLADLSREELAGAPFTIPVSMCLLDKHARQFSFDEVGSGVGYVLPVICALFSPSKYSVRYIHQPELHLHPAPQAVLGDAIIESSQSGKQVFVETHSEHLLLRVLKRIRQTYSNVNIRSEFRIKADDVCVLYFDPLPNGVTTVKRLRISRDGEFMDRWPNGFFPERDQELFDE